ncbi:hypothetical protein BPJM79_20279 [Bacillus pumilus]
MVILTVHQTGTRVKNILDQKYFRSIFLLLTSLLSLIFVI